MIVEDIAQQLISILQQDPCYVPKPPGKMEIEAPSNEDPFELLEIALKTTCDQMESKKVPFLVFFYYFYTNRKKTWMISTVLIKEFSISFFPVN